MVLYIALAIALMLVPYPSRLRRIAIAGCVVLAVVLTVVGLEFIATFLGDGVLMGGLSLALAGGFLIRAAVIWRRARIGAVGN
jgi:hypothetical protein